MARRVFTQTTVFLLVLFVPLPAPAQTVYIDDKVMVGLHQDNDIDSPIIMTLASGTALELIKRDTPLSKVREPGGNSGWIDNRYLVDVEPGRTQLLQLQEKAGKLESELAALKADGRNVAPSPNTDNQKLAALQKENENLKQQLHSEQLKVGELQAQAAELRNQLSQAGTEEEPPGGADAQDGTTSGQAPTWIADIRRPFGASNWRVILTGIAVCIIIGLLAGIYLMDWLNRRRHGGFRI